MHTDQLIGTLARHAGPAPRIAGWRAMGLPTGPHLGRARDLIRLVRLDGFENHYLRRRFGRGWRPYHC